MAEITRIEYKAAQEVVSLYEAQEGTEDAIIKRVLNKGTRELVDFEWISDDRIRVKKLRYVLDLYIVIIENTFLNPVDGDSVYAKSNTVVTLKTKTV